MARVGTAELEVRFRHRTDDRLFALGFWHLCIASGLIVGLLLGAVLR